MEQDKIYIGHILGAITSIETYISGVASDDFRYDSEHAKTRDAIVRQFEIIGEATKNLSPESKTDERIPWKDIMGMRDNLIHEYFGIDYEVVWKAIQDDLPKLKAVLQEMK